MSPQPVFLLRLQPDARLVRLARRGHAEAFEAIVLRYRGPMLAFCRGMLRGDAAQDIAQETFIRAWQALEQGTEVRELRAWLFTIARRLALRELAAGRARPEELTEAPSSEPCPATEVERRAEIGQLLSAVAALPEDQRDALVWTEMEGRSRTEIATVLGVSEGAVRQLVYRARGAVRSAAMALTPGPLLARMLGRGERQPLIAELLAGGSSQAVPATVGTVAAVVVAASLGAGVATAPRGGADTSSRAEPKPGVRVQHAGGPRAAERGPLHRFVTDRPHTRGHAPDRPRAGVKAPRRGGRRPANAPTPAAPVPTSQEAQPAPSQPAPAQPQGGMGGGDAGVEPKPAPAPQPVDAPPPANNTPSSNYVPADNNVPPPTNYVPPPPPDPGGDYTPDEGPPPE
jgi:RNA polymerase sigma factor (sigma-70 family)